VAQWLGSYAAPANNPLPIEVGVIGGSERLRPSVQVINADATATGAVTWSYAGPKQDYTVVLSESGADIVVRITQKAAQPAAGFPQALLIDELRVE
jgi:hypothetical protein